MEASGKRVSMEPGIMRPRTELSTTTPAMISAATLRCLTCYVIKLPTIRATSNIRVICSSRMDGPDPRSGPPLKTPVAAWLGKDGWGRTRAGGDERREAERG